MSFANSPRATIHLDHIKSNFSLALRSAPNERTMAVVKANAYGHGAAEVAQCLVDADAFAVARVEEAVMLRSTITERPIVVLEGYLDKHEYLACQQYNLTPVVHSDHQLEWLDEAQPCWLKVNTGMFRLGFHWQRAEFLAKRFAGHNLQGVMSHFADADEPGSANNEMQLARFHAVCSKVDPNLPRCIGNSAALLYTGERLASSATDWARPGIMLYGGSPNGKPDTQLRAGMTLTAPVIAVNALERGDCVGYGSTFIADQACRVAVVALGYADGYPREAPAYTPVLVGGQRRYLVGRISMDMCTVLLEPEDVVVPGNRVEFWGEHLSVDEVATHLGTISYTLLAGLGFRVTRQFTGG